jgi:hypothetical protein
MALPAPEFIEQANIQDVPPTYEWSERTYEKLDGYKSSNLKTVLVQMTGRANLAFALGAAEWVSRRLERFTDCKPLLDYSEAVWATMIDRRYLAREQMPDVEYTWDDRAKDIVMFVGNRLTLAYYDCWSLDSDRIGDTAHLVAAARHVLPDKKRFDDWSKKVLSRLVAIYPATGTVGSPVPREVLEIEQEFAAEKTVDYLNGFLRGLSPAANPFLAQPASLASLPNFPGTPYKSVSN